MTPVFTSQPSIEPKRKRNSDEYNRVELENGRHVKKSAAENSLVYTRNIPSYLPTFSQPLTPDDSSDDESMSCEHDMWSHRRTLEDDPNRLSSGSISSVRVNVDDFEDDMDMTSSPMVVARHGRRPDMRTPPRLPNLQSASSVQLDERVPTPTTSKFKGSDASMRTSNGRHDRMSRYTNLSPVMCEETGLPSPVASPDTDTQMAMDSASDGFSGLRVHCHDDGMVMHDESVDVDTHESDVASPRKNGKTARLHMGFRTDCEKCAQRVPGHYSHIMWS